MKKIILLLALFLASSSFAREEAKMKNTGFVTALFGSGAMGKSESAPSELEKDQESQATTGGSLTLGYRWERFSLELLYTQFGSSKINFDDYYSETHKPSFIGGGLHWTWAWFDLKLGWGTVNDKVKYKAGPKSKTFSATPNDKNAGGRAGYFGIGLNFDLGKRTEFVIDYTAYAWTQPDEQTITIDGTSTSSDENKSSIGMIGIGLRRFF